MNENAARLDWSGAGVRVPRRFISPRVVRLAVERALGEPSIRERAREMQNWALKHDSPAAAARLVERLGSPSGAHEHENGPVVGPGVRDER
jgi:UDP:flavonoid glycosyltransferase YjiC (YdhE family)